MAVATLEEIQEIAKKNRKHTYPEIPGLPKRMRGFSPFLKGRDGDFPPGMPKDIQKKVINAVPVFGMTIQVYYPEKITSDLGWDFTELWRSYVDPLVIGQKDGKFYLIAAWE